ncbi:RNA polymerase [Polychaeton citri CBS 116435]|uniref:DNA-directed RNA polymerases I, II, and III subunit RPABC3 n=1 Tax=Polychaeton citri CBS 116435 TaxID=1314669 RepID=A0A9P4QAS1_9PEZI|nr:RNA polymerase [Polychaeton citri CBS 116435]
MSQDTQLYEDGFTITQVIDGKYDRVMRVHGTSSDNQTSITLDLNSELYPLQTGEQITLLLATTLNLDGTKDEGKGWREKAGETTLADLYDYVCFGKMYRFEAGEGQNIKVYISFGGLLLCLDGPYKKLSPLRIDNVYMLLKR